MLLRFAILFLLVAIIATLFGAPGVAAIAFDGAKFLFVIFTILAVVAIIFRGGWPRDLV